MEPHISRSVSEKASLRAAHSADDLVEKYKHVQCSGEHQHKSAELVDILQPQEAQEANKLMEYSSAALGTASDTNLATIDKAQNHDLLFISGGTKSTPTSACEIECDMQPMSIRRDSAIVTTYERMRGRITFRTRS